MFSWICLSPQWIDPFPSIQHTSRLALLQTMYFSINRASCEMIPLSLESRERLETLSTGPPMASLRTATEASYQVRTCRCNCASCCTCRHSTGKGRDLRGQDWPLADGTWQHTFRFHMKVHRCTSSYKYRPKGTLSNMGTECSRYQGFSFVLPNPLGHQ